MCSPSDSHGCVHPTQLGRNLLDGVLQEFVCIKCTWTARDVVLVRVHAENPLLM
jgi:hypothetical protein